MKVESALENTFEISPFWIITPVNLDREKSAVHFNFTIRDVFVNSKKKFSAMPLMKASLRKYPEIVKAMEIRHIRYNREMEEIAEREEEGTTLVIRPPEALGISRTEKDPVELRRVYEVGREEAERRLEEVKAFLAGDAVS